MLHMNFLLPLKGSLSSTSTYPPFPPLAGEYCHDAKADVKQTQRVRHQTPHRSHPAHCTKHAATAVRAPNNRRAAHDVSAGRVHRHHHADQTDDDERQQTIPEHGRAAGVSKRAGHAGRGLVRMYLMMAPAFLLERRGRHERENGVEREGADQS